jgi:hypothetical protein
MSATITPAVHVVIKSDRQLVLDFLSWQLNSRVYPMRNPGSANGPDFYSGTFAERNRLMIEAFFRDYSKARE